MENDTDANRTAPTGTGDGGVHVDKGDDERPLPPRRRRRGSALNMITQFVSSGFFFMLVGTAFLAMAYWTIGDTHAGLTFVFVVLGIAILLYGTGTQSVGSFDSGDKATEARTKIALAGGAGALAFAVAAGIVFKAKDIRSAFREEKRFLQVRFVADGDAQSSLANYYAEVLVDGVEVPVVRSGRKYIVALVPYDLSEDEEQRVRLEATFIQVVPGPTVLKPRIDKIEEVEIANRDYGGLDWDIYKKVVPVSLIETPTVIGSPSDEPAPPVEIIPE